MASTVLQYHTHSVVILVIKVIKLHYSVNEIMTDQWIGAAGGLVF